MTPDAVGSMQVAGSPRSRAIILHGMSDEDEYFDPEQPSPSNAHWIPWLQKQLSVRGYDAQTPDIVDSFRPDYELWCMEFERHVVARPMTLVGHSCGAGFLVRWLTEHPDVLVEALVLVAPWLDPQRADTTDFFDFTIDRSLPERVGRFRIFASVDDMSSVRESVALLRSCFPDVPVHEYDDMGHFCRGDMGTDQFPDLLEAIVR